MPVVDLNANAPPTTANTAMAVRNTLAFFINKVAFYAQKAKVCFNNDLPTLL